MGWPKIKILKAYLVHNRKKYPPGSTLNLKSGDHVWVAVAIKNAGESAGYAKVQLNDTDPLKDKLWVSGKVYLKPGQVKLIREYFVADRKAKAYFAAYGLSDDGYWIETDKIGYWILNVEVPPPNPKFSRVGTWFEYGGKHYVAGSNITVSAGAKVKFRTIVTNAHGQSGEVYIDLVNSLNNEIIWKSPVFKLVEDSSREFTGEIEIDNEMVLEFRAYGKTQTGWKNTDTLGKWFFKVEEQKPPKPKKPPVHGTSCKPLSGKKKYDSRFRIDTPPFVNVKWWYCDPWCKPKQGDWVGFWVGLKSRLTAGQINNIMTQITKIAEKFKDIIHLETIEYSANMPDMRFLVAFKRDSPYSLHDWMYKYFAGAFGNLIKWVNYMGCDEDFGIVEITGKYFNLAPNECCEANIVNYGRVRAPYLLFVYDIVSEGGSVSQRYVYCTTDQISANSSKPFNACLEVVDKNTRGWCVFVKHYPPYPCSVLSKNYPHSPNKLVIGTKPVKRPKPKIVSENTYILYKGKKLPPGEYDIPYGSSVLCRVTVVNVGDEGDVRVVIRDGKNTILDKTMTLGSNKKIILDKQINVTKELNIKVETYYRSGQSWVKYDEYGC